MTHDKRAGGAPSRRVGSARDLGSRPEGCEFTCTGEGWRGWHFRLHRLVIENLGDVTTFDVLRSPKRQQPFVLLQPQPTLQEIFPLADLVTATKHKGLPNLDRAYVGLVEESGSLFAMSPDRFPLVVFGDSNTDRRWHSIDPPPGSSSEDDSINDFPIDVESATRVAKIRKLREMCRNGASDVRCLTGVRPLGSDSQSRLSRLLDGAPSVMTPPPPSSPYPNSNNNRPNVDVEIRDEDRLPDGNATMKTPPAWGNHSGPRLEDAPAGGLLGMDGSTQATVSRRLALQRSYCSCGCLPVPWDRT
ncbi:hypothetical protein LXA43DRAFT_716375 [Ganoderma leucocontextum]|nr:hypothetical protein LXA43DRAFT_716375 [Ganoderma leucocontextum]